MAIDRDATLRTAAEHLRGGRLTKAIAEYTRLVDEYPRDWTTANTLGDLHLRAGDTRRAVALYSRIADHFLAQGFLPRAAALYRKILKVQPGEENALARLADASLGQGLTIDALGCLAELERRRRAREDHAGADELVLRMELIESGVIERPAATTPAVASPQPAVVMTAPAPDTPQAVTESTPAAANAADAPAAGSHAGPALSPADDLENVFAGIRAQIETGEPEGDPAEYMALGCSYAEIGRTEDAIAAFVSAARSPRHRFSAGLQIAQLQRDRGDIPAAIEWYERASGAPAPTEEEARLLLYDLGDLLEMMGEGGRALAVYLELAADAPDYRDVARRIARLSKDAGGG